MAALRRQVPGRQLRGAINSPLQFPCLQPRGASGLIECMDAKRQAAVEILERLRGEGFQAFLVGGCVRDLVMGVDPKDYDISTDATPEQVVRLFPESLTVGAQFGVVIVPREEGNVEVATFRSDGRYTDGRHPSEVRYSKTPQQDVLRRDFTINGLLYDPLKEQVLDYVGGQADIRARRVRTIGDPYERFSEDRLRMLRAVRFAARLKFTLDAAAEEAIQKQAAEIRQVSAERVRDEILKILTEGQAPAGFRAPGCDRLASGGAAGGQAHARRGPAAGVSPRGRCVGPHHDDAGGPALAHAHAGFGSAPARRGQAAHVLRPRTNPVR